MKCITYMNREKKLFHEVFSQDTVIPAKGSTVVKNKTRYNVYEVEHFIDRNEIVVTLTRIF